MPIGQAGLASFTGYIDHNRYAAGKICKRDQFAIMLHGRIHKVVDGIFWYQVVFLWRFNSTFQCRFPQMHCFYDMIAGLVVVHEVIANRSYDSKNEKQHGKYVRSACSIILSRSLPALSSSFHRWRMVTGSIRFFFGGSIRSRSKHL